MIRPVVSAAANGGAVGTDVFESETEDAAIAALGLTEVVDTVDALTALGITEIIDTRYIVLQPFGATVDCATGDLAGDAFVSIPSLLDGWNVTDVTLGVVTPGVTGSMTVQLRRARAGSVVNVCSTAPVLASGKYDSSESGNTAAVINASNDDLATGDQLYANVTGIHTTAAQGLTVTIKVEAAS
jgi:hypothetical protein